MQFKITIRSLYAILKSILLFLASIFLETTRSEGMKIKCEESPKPRADLLFAANTYVVMADARSPISLKELATNGASYKFPVWCNKNRSLTQSLATVEYCGTQRMLEIHLNDGSMFECAFASELWSSTLVKLKARNSLNQFLESKLYSNQNLTPINPLKVINVVLTSQLEDVYALKVTDANNFYIVPDFTSSNKWNGLAILVGSSS